MRRWCFAQQPETWIRLHTLTQNESIFSVLGSRPSRDSESRELHWHNRFGSHSQSIALAIVSYRQAMGTSYSISRQVCTNVSAGTQHLARESLAKSCAVARAHISITHWWSKQTTRQTNATASYIYSARAILVLANHKLFVLPRTAYADRNRHTPHTHTFDCIGCVRRTVNLIRYSNGIRKYARANGKYVFRVRF